MKPSPAFKITGSASLLAALALSACATTVDPNADPYEGFNRQMFAFNDGLDRAVIEPVAKGYRAVTNEPVRAGVTNFVNNLGEPVTFANEVLQGKLPDAGATVGRFVINTTIGIAGLFDTAGAMGIQRTKEDFGQTLGVWGIGSGPYLVLPVLGSSSPRDLFGTGTDIAMNPLTYAEFDGDDATRVGVVVLNGLSAREDALETVEDVRTQVDPYVTVRRFYVRGRAAAIRNNAPMPNDIEKVPDSELDF
ncbi:MAG TPA: VacJ family lipoprotein [Hyphomonadaceae bacterium]|nr:VacJ family lipoprotein [Hyphomonadaceae bacterium]